MPIIPATDLPPLLRAHKRLLGLDLGTKTIGVAASDGLGLAATPLETIRREKFTKDAARLLALAKDRDSAGFVLGLPINMDGSEGPRAQSTRQFAANLADLTPLPIVLWDERLSTVAVTRTMLEADLSRSRQNAVVDKMAAAFILQGVLDYLRAHPSG